MKRARRICWRLAAALLAGADARSANPPGALDLPPSNVIPAPVDVAPTAAPRAATPGRSEPAIRSGRSRSLR